MTHELDELVTESRNASSGNIDSMTALEIVQLMSREDRGVAEAVASEAGRIARAVEEIAERFARGGRLIYVGAGTSGRLGVLDAAECPPTFRTPPEMVVGVIAGGAAALTHSIEGAEDDADSGRRDVAALEVGARDAVVGIAASGRTPYVLGAIAQAREVDAFTVGLSCNPDSPLACTAELAITPVVGPEVVAGSTRLKAGTATKMVLNMLTTGALVLRGKTFGNLMVDVQASNDKLRARVGRIVREVTGLSEGDATRLLESCDFEVKTCLVAHRLGLSADEARARIAAADGHVRRALESAP